MKAFHKFCDMRMSGKAYYVRLSQIVSVSELTFGSENAWLFFAIVECGNTAEPYWMASTDRPTVERWHAELLAALEPALTLDGEPA